MSEAFRDIAHIDAMPLQYARKRMTCGVCGELRDAEPGSDTAERNVAAVHDRAYIQGYAEFIFTVRCKLEYKGIWIPVIRIAYIAYDLPHPVGDDGLDYLGPGAAAGLRAHIPYLPANHIAVPEVQHIPEIYTVAQI